jgi:arabinose-5-phosphate isomerase
VVTAEGELLGVFTDGDLRRAIDHRIDINVARVGEVMTRNCKTVSSEMLAAEALTVMEDNKITALVVTDGRRPAGVVHMHDLLRAGVV